MDFGASFHTTHNSEALQNLVIGDFGKVRLAENITLDVTGMWHSVEDASRFLDFEGYQSCSNLDEKFDFC